MLRNRAQGEDRRAQVDRRGIQGVDGSLPLIEFFEAQGFVDIEPARIPHESLCEVGEDAPVPLLVRVGQRAAGNGPPDPQVVELVGHRSEARLDIPEAVPVRELGKGHGQVLVPAGEASDPSVPVVATNAPVQNEPRAMRHDLRKCHLPLVHQPLPWVSAPHDATEDDGVQIGAASLVSQAVVPFDDAGAHARLNRTLLIPEGLWARLHSLLEEGEFHDAASVEAAIREAVEASPADKQ